MARQDLQPAPDTRQSPGSPAAESRRVRRACRILAVGRGLFDTQTRGDPFTGLLPAAQRVVSAGNHPFRQKRESLAARAATAAANADAVVVIIVSETNAQSVSDDGADAAERAESGQLAERDYPGSQLSMASGSEITRINGWREGLPLTGLTKVRSAGWAFTLR